MIGGEMIVGAIIALMKRHFAEKWNALCMETVYPVPLPTPNDDDDSHLLRRAEVEQAARVDRRVETAFAAVGRA